MDSTVQGPRPFIITMSKVVAEPKTGSMSTSSRMSKPAMMSLILLLPLRSPTHAQVEMPTEGLHSPEIRFRHCKPRITPNKTATHSMTAGNKSM